MIFAKQLGKLCGVLYAFFGCVCKKYSVKKLLTNPIGRCKVGFQVNITYGKLKRCCASEATNFKVLHNRNFLCIICQCCKLYSFCDCDISFQWDNVFFKWKRPNCGPVFLFLITQMILLFFDKSIIVWICT